MKSSRRALMTLAAAVALGCSAIAIAAEDFPQRPIKLVVGFAPGGPTDLAARVLAPALSKTIGQQVFVENRAGAGGMIAADQVAKATADGYTLMFAGDGALTVLPHLSNSTTYDVVKDFVPVRLALAQSSVLVVNADKGLTDVKAVVAAAKAKPGQLNYGSGGNSTPSHLIGALFESETGVEMTHVPYKGAGPATVDLLGGRLDIMFVGMPVAVQNASRKQVKLLAVAGDRRSPALPDVPTFAEAGVKGLGDQTRAWWAVMAPSGLPAPVLAKLADATQAALADPETVKAYAALGIDVINEDGTTVSKAIVDGSARWGALIKSKNIKAE
ncbi:MAG: tripartite tricarboxylate transporter substrate binding protein [Variovorax sp.]